MKQDKDNQRNLSKEDTSRDKENLPGYPIYPESEDIYKNYLEEKEIDPEEIQKTKEFKDEASGNDLDIPGSELDDEMENIGSEDEENNYYSIGGDDHDDLDENQDE